MKSLFAALLCLAMVLMLLPMTAFAANEPTVLNVSQGRIVINDTGALIKPRTGEDIIYSLNTAGYKIIGSNTEASNTISVEGSLTHTITLSDVYIRTQAPFVIKSGDTATVNLILEGNNTLSDNGDNPGLYVPSGAKLTISGTGSLTANGSSRCAGIGSGKKDNCGDVEISSGTITAIGGYFGGAGIGGGYDGHSGTVTISGGMVKATGGGVGGAGIGGGYGGNSGTVIISGGTVIAHSDGSGAGIGGGSGTFDSDGGNGGTVMISGGTVTASSTDYGAGIGGGYGGDSNDIEIKSGTVIATGGVYGGAGIGGGGYGGGSSYHGSGGDGGTVKISGGTVTATGGELGGAGIGGGAEGGDSRTVIISGGVVTATGNGRGAGIGGGKMGCSYNVEISSGTVTAIGGQYGGAGIGGGGSYGNSNTVTISGGTVTATGKGGGAGIGGGGDGGNNYFVTINGGTVTATGNSGGAGIGGGGDIRGFDYFQGLFKYCGGGTVIISGGNVKAKAMNGGDDIGKGGVSGERGTRRNNSGADVYLTTLTLTGASDETPIADLDAGGYSYGMKDVKPLDGKLYFYLPANTTINRLTTGETPQRVFAEEMRELITIQSNIDNAAALTPVAADFSNAAISGVTDAELTPQSVTVTLYKYKFKQLPALTDVSDWFTNMPDGLLATISSDVAQDATTITFAFSGTPTTQSASAISLTIPAMCLVESVDLSVAANENARWAITSELLSGDEYTPSLITVYNDPVQTDATIWLTGAGLSGNDLLITERDPQGSTYKALLKLADPGDVFKTYNIYLRSGKKSTGDAMEMTFDLSAKYAGRDFTLVHQKADGTYEYFYDTADSNGDLTFGPLCELSPFMLVMGTLTAGAVDIPQTGDNSQTALWMGAALVIAAASITVVALCRRRRAQG